MKEKKKVITGWIKTNSPEMLVVVTMMIAGWVIGGVFLSCVMLVVCLLGAVCLWQQKRIGELESSHRSLSRKLGTSEEAQNEVEAEIEKRKVLSQWLQQRVEATLRRRYRYVRHLVACVGAISSQSGLSHRTKQVGDTIALEMLEALQAAVHDEREFVARCPQGLVNIVPIDLRLHTLFFEGSVIDGVLVIGSSPDDPPFAHGGIKSTAPRRRLAAPSWGGCRFSG